MTYKPGYKYIRIAQVESEISGPTVQLHLSSFVCFLCKITFNWYE